MPDDDLVMEITQLIEYTILHGEGYHKMWAITFAIKEYLPPRSAFAA